MATSIPTRAEALAALDRISLHMWAKAEATVQTDLATVRKALDGLIEPVATHRFWHIGMLVWEDCACSTPKASHGDWYPLQFH